MQGNSLVRIQPDFVARKLYFGRAESTINLGPDVVKSSNFSLRRETAA